jgi:hypothetical protein
MAEIERFMQTSLDLIAGIFCNRAAAVWLCGARRSVNQALEAKKEADLHACARALP